MPNLLSAAQMLIYVGLREHGEAQDLQIFLAATMLKTKAFRCNGDQHTVVRSLTTSGQVGFLQP